MYYFKHDILWHQTIKNIEKDVMWPVEEAFWTGERGWYIYIYIYLKNIQAESRSDQGLSSSKKDKEAPSMHNENSPNLMPYIYSIPGLHVEKNKS